MYEDVQLYKWVGMFRRILPPPSSGKPKKCELRWKRLLLYRERTGEAVVEFRRYALENRSLYQRHCLNFRSRIGLRLYARHGAPVP